MKKLLLTSDGFTTPNLSKRFLELVGKKPEEIKVLFVPTASKAYNDEDYLKRKAVSFARREEEVMGLGLKKENLVWLYINNISAAGDLDRYDVMYVCGGNTFYLLSEVRRTGFDQKILNFINGGGLYVGESAGSYMACPTIEMAYWKHADGNIVGLKDLTGLNLVPFLLSVHYKPELAEILKKEISKARYPVKIISDGQALEVIGDIYKIIK